MKDSDKRLLIFIFWTILILIIIGIPGNYIPKPIGFIRWLSPDKIVHLLLFAPFAIFFMQYFFSLSEPNIFKEHPIKSTLIVGTVYAILTEMLQFFVFIGRNGNIYDAAADIIGVITGIYIFYKFLKKNYDSK